MSSHNLNQEQVILLYIITFRDTHIIHVSEQARWSFCTTDSRYKVSFIISDLLLHCTRIWKISALLLSLLI